MTTLQQLPRRERERLVRRQEIIEAARTAFARKGFTDTTLDDVAELAEFGKGTLYNYFENKEALFASVLQDSFDRVMAIAREALAAERSFEEKIDRFVSEELRYFIENPATMHLMMRESHHLRGSNPMMQMLPQLLQMLGDTIAAEQKRRKVIANAEPMDLATILINMLFGQFTSRVYRRILCSASNSNGDYKCSLSEIFGAMSSETIDREVAAATKLIHTVFFTGVTR